MRRQGSGTPSVGTLRSSVENELQKLLPHGKAKKQTVARVLAMSERTLTRRLVNEGTTYEDLVDQLRRSLACQYIKAPSMSLSQIAWLLGYERSTSFNHAFVRWTGRSPSAVRKEEQLPAISIERQKEIDEFGVGMLLHEPRHAHRPHVCRMARKRWPAARERRTA